MNAQAQSMGTGPLSIPELVARSDLVVIGSVASVQSDWNSDHTMIFTRIDLKVAEVLKGSVSGRPLSFFQLGGQVGDAASAIAGAPTFAPGEGVLMFLSVKSDGRLGVVELFQGKFSIRSDPSSGAEMVFRQIPGMPSPHDEISLEQARQLVREVLGN